MLKIHAVGGFSEVGKNMTAVESGEDVTICDAGLFIPALVGVSEREKVPTEHGMRAIGALPDDHYLDEKNLRQGEVYGDIPCTFRSCRCSSIYCS